jgi:endonuclease/exonuclease/phosphatase family metal-dependent hydrolase
MSRARFDTVASVKWILPDPGTAPPHDWCAAVGPTLVHSSALSELVPDALVPTLSSFVVVTWNVHAGAGDVLAFIQDLRSGALTGAPVESFALLLQETYRTGPDVPASADDLTSRISVPPPSGERVDVQELAARAGLHAFYAPSMPNGASEVSGVAEDRGNAILSTLPLAELQAIELPYEAQRRVAVTGSVRGRTADGTSWSVRLASGHLDTRSRWSRLLDSFGRGRARQADQLARSLEGESVLLGADLNTWSPSFLEGALGVLYESFPDTPRFEGATFIAAGMIPRRLDHLLVRLPEGHTADVRRIPQRYGSDHYPLLAVVRFAPSNLAQGLGQNDR